MIILIVNQFTYFRSSFSDFAAKYSKEERFRAIEKMRDREAMFTDYVSELRRKEKEEARSHKEKVGSYISTAMVTTSLLSCDMTWPLYKVYLTELHNYCISCMDS